MITIDFAGHEIEHLREMGRQQLLGDREAVIDSLQGRGAPMDGVQASERIVFVSRLMGRLEVFA
jgi:hypothetical protein